MVLGGSSRAWFHMNHIHDSDFTTFNFEHHTFWTHHRVRLLPWTLAGVRFARIPQWYYHPSWPRRCCISCPGNCMRCTSSVSCVSCVWWLNFSASGCKNLCVSSLFYFGTKLCLLKWGDHWWRRTGFLSLLANGAKRDHPDPIRFSETFRCLVCKGLGQWM